MTMLEVSIIPPCTYAQVVKQFLDWQLYLPLAYIVA